MRTEFEKDSAPSLENALSTRNIQAVIFDLDNTVFDTDPYFTDRKFKSFLEVTTHFPIENELPEETARKISSDVHRKFLERNCKPLPVKVEYERGLKDFYGENFHPKMSEIIHRYFDDFYHNSPEMYEESAKLFNFLYNYENTKFFAANSLAGREWTKIKIDYMSSMCNIPDFPFYTTDINYPKDWVNPIRDAMLNGVNLESILVIGDSLESDIKPAIKLGVEHLIWIDWRGRATKEIPDLADTAEIIVVNNLSDIWDLE